MKFHKIMPGAVVTISSQPRKWKYSLKASYAVSSSSWFAFRMAENSAYIDMKETICTEKHQFIACQHSPSASQLLSYNLLHKKSFGSKCKCSMCLCCWGKQTQLQNTFFLSNSPAPFLCSFFFLFFPGEITDPEAEGAAWAASSLSHI